MVYLDNNATTPLAPAVAEAIARALEEFGNPSSAHAAGRRATAVIEDARASVAQLLGTSDPSEIVFTSGGTESDNWAILGTMGSRHGKNHIVTTRVEHEAVRRVCEYLERAGVRVTWLEVDANGMLDPDQLSGAVTDETALVSVMLANNETGVIFPIDEIGNIVKERSDAIFHVDGVNAAGKVSIDLENSAVDLFSISAHKFHGPKGIGALYIRNGVELSSFMRGGGQEGGRRAGTEAVHQIAGIGAAAEFVSDLSDMDRIRELRDLLESRILESISGTSVNGPADHAHRLRNTTNMSFEGINGEMILHLLDEEGVCVSTGSACNSKSSSPVLEAMNVPYSLAMGSIRFSLGRFNRRDEIEYTLERLPGIIEKLRDLGS